MVAPVEGTVQELTVTTLRSSGIERSAAHDDRSGTGRVEVEALVAISTSASCMSASARS